MNPVPMAPPQASTPFTPAYPTSGAFPPPAMPAPAAPNPMMSIPLDSFTAPQGPSLSPTDAAMLAQLLGGQPGMAAPGGIPGPTGYAPTSDLQVVPTASGVPMILENPATPPGMLPGMPPGGAPTALPGMPPSIIPGLSPASGTSSFWGSPVGWGTAALLIIGSIFGIRFFKNRGKEVAESVLDKMIQGKEELYENIRKELGDEEALIGLEEKTMTQIKEMVDQNSAKLQGDEAVDQLVSRTSTLFQHARSLYKGDSLSKKITDAFEEALAQIRQKLAKEEAEQVAETATSAA